MGLEPNNSVHCWYFHVLIPKPCFLWYRTFYNIDSVFFWKSAHQLVSHGGTQNQTWEFPRAHLRKTWKSCNLVCNLACSQAWFNSTASISSAEAQICLFHEFVSMLLPAFSRFTEVRLPAGRVQEVRSREEFWDKEKLLCRSSQVPILQCLLWVQPCTSAWALQLHPQSSGLALTSCQTSSVLGTIKLWFQIAIGKPAISDPAANQNAIKFSFI